MCKREDIKLLRKKNSKNLRVDFVKLVSQEVKVFNVFQQHNRSIQSQVSSYGLDRQFIRMFFICQKFISNR